MYSITGLPPSFGHERTLQLQDEIATLEARLAEMGEDGDCAYERAMSRLYTGMLEERRRRLATLVGIQPA